MIVNQKAQAKGFFKLVVEGGKRGRVDLGEELGHKDGWIPNLILDSGITAFLNETTSSSDSSFGFIQLGTGTSTPVATQTGLENRVTGGGNPSKSTGKSFGYNPTDGYSYTRATHQFDPGQATGTWTEIGSAKAATGPCFSRALFTNSGGTPTPITILADEYLTVTYELRWWWITPSAQSIDMTENAVVVATTTVTYNAPSAADLESYGAPQNFYAAVSGASISYGAAATGNSRNLIVKFGLSQGNPSISSVPATLSINNLFRSSPICTFSPALPKTNVHEVNITFTFTLERR